jgi:hypothetical protein
LRRLAVLLVLLCISRAAPAQHYFEFRGADSKYRFADWNYTFANSAIVDLFYVGVPGSNEFNVGGGYAFKMGAPLTIAPLVYFVAGKEGGQRGIKAAVLIACERDGWKLNAFFGHYAKVGGDVTKYQVLDTLDFTRALGKGWETGVSNGFFHAAGAWNPQIGPVVKRSDRLGSWSASYRFGPQREFRIVRVFILTK